MARCSESALSRRPRRLGPPQPRPTTLTLSPVFPMVVYSIVVFFLHLVQSSRFRVQSLYRFQGIHKVWLREEYTLNLEPGTLNQTSIALHPDPQHLPGRTHLSRSAQCTTYPSFTPFNFCDAGSQFQRLG